MLHRSIARRALDDPSAAPRRAEHTAPRALRLVAGGDIIFGRYIHGTLQFAGGPEPFVHLAPLFRAADLAVVNLETPITDADPPSKRSHAGWLTFRAPPERTADLVDAGLDLLITANNHAEDCGPAGIADTRRHLDAAGLAHVGTHPDGDPFAPVTLDIGGLRVAVLAATSKRNRGRPRPGERVPVAYLTLDDTLAQLPDRVRAVRARGEHDLVIVSLHWGAGGERHVHGKQIAIARALIDAGADLILGHHAHILQAVERYGDGFVVYGMGNLVFDMREREGRETALFDLTLAPRGARWRVERLVVHPFIYDTPKTPTRPATAEEAGIILAPVARDSRVRFDTHLVREGDTLVWTRDPEPVAGP